MECHVGILNGLIKGMKINKEVDKIVFFDIVPNSHLVQTCSLLSIILAVIRCPF